jgi:AraC-like DNA-binding protein/quercetin dioxygenase-like cupin family protein
VPNSILVSWHETKFLKLRATSNKKKFFYNDKRGEIMNQNVVQIQYQTGKESNQPYWTPKIEIIYVVQGTLRLGIEKNLIHVYEEEIYIIDRGLSHYFLNSTNTEYIIVKIDISGFDNFLTVQEKTRIIDAFEITEKHSINWPQKLQNIFRQQILNLYEIEENNANFKSIEILRHISILILIVTEQLPKTKIAAHKINKSTLINKEMITKIEQIYDYINNYYYEEIRIEDAAKILNLSPNYFSRFFKKQVGISFHQFLNEYRINQAKFLLSEEILPMTEIAEKSGFSSSKTFHRVFKKYEGISPLKYQKIIIEKK